MDNFDPAMEQRVWERVNSQMDMDRYSSDMQPMLAAAEESAAAYRYLAQSESGKRREKLLHLSSEAQSDAAAIKGMMILSGMEIPQLAHMRYGRESRRRVLAECCHRCREMMNLYSARIADPEYGAVFQAMADRQRNGLENTLELIGEG